MGQLFQPCRSTDSGNSTFSSNDTYFPPATLYPEIRHVSLTLMVGEVSSYDTVLVLVYFPGSDSWGALEAITVSDTIDGYCVKTYEFDTSRWKMQVYVFDEPLILAWNVVTTQPLEMP